MTKQEVRKLSNKVIDYFVDLTEFERRDDITLRVTDEDETEGDYAAHVRILHSHGLYTITVYMTPDMPEQSIVKSLLHELAHVFTNEAYTFFKTFVEGEDDDDSSNQTKSFMLGFERIAKRNAVIYYKLWKLRGKK
jgi:hypothetical protein